MAIRDDDNLIGRLLRAEPREGLDPARTDHFWIYTGSVATMVQSLYPLNLGHPR